MISKRTFVCIVAQIACAACSQSSPATESGRPSIEARGVRIDVARPEGRIEIRGDELIVESVKERMQLNGNTSVKMPGPGAFEARSASITLLGGASKIEMTGDVEARFRTASTEASDAGR